MAKVKAPLFGLGASGQLGKALVYFNWKGIDVVRTHVVPSNPKTSRQTTQRGYMGDAVDEIHDAQARVANQLDSDDQVAYSAWGSIYAKPRTWFNQAVKMWLDVMVDGKTPVIYSNGSVSVTTPSAISLGLYQNEETESDLNDGKFYFGTSKTNLINSAIANVQAPFVISLAAVDLSAFLTAGVKYFWQFRPDAADPCDGADSGIYNFVAT